MTKGGIIYCICIVLLASCSSRIIPGKPSLSDTDFNLDSLPDSEINIPIQVSLQPVYRLAEKNIDTVFTSPHYPDEWIQDGCDIRYKYIFRRGPLVLNSAGAFQHLGFTGYYKIYGSTRICVNNTVVSPWTPPCRCGFTEGERKVNVSFSSSVAMQPDYKARLTILRKEPEPLDKCEVCFWGQDITKHVMKGLKTELDLAKLELEKGYGMADLKPRFQQVWDELNKSYNLYNLGWLKLNPKSIKLTRIFFRNDSLQVLLGLSARPLVSFEKPEETQSPVPDIGDRGISPGFHIFLDAVLNYDSLSKILNAQLMGKKLELNQGVIKKIFIINKCRLYGTGNEKLIIRVDFSGSNSGTVYLTGRPEYNPTEEVIEIKNLDFDVKTKNLLLGTADWLFNKKIIRELKAYTRYSLSNYFNATKIAATQQLNREWKKGIRSSGSITDIKLVGIYPLNKNLIIRSNCSGTLTLQTGDFDFSF